MAAEPKKIELQVLLPNPQKGILESRNQYDDLNRLGSESVDPHNVEAILPITKGSLYARQYGRNTLPGNSAWVFIDNGDDPIVKNPPEQLVADMGVVVPVAPVKMARGGTGYINADAVDHVSPVKGWFGHPSSSRAVVTFVSGNDIVVEEPDSDVRRNLVTARAAFVSRGPA